MHEKLRGVESGFQVFTREGGDEVGAVRGVGPKHLDIYIENSGDFVVDATAVKAVHDGKVILDLSRLEPRLKEAVAHAHDREDPKL